MLTFEIRFDRVRMTKDNSQIFMLESHSSAVFLLVVCFALNFRGLALGLGAHRLLWTWIASELISELYVGFNSWNNAETTLRKY